MKLAVFIGRLNPPHLGHIDTIKKALSENDKVLVLLGTPEEKDDKNILNFKQRKNLLKIIFTSEINLKISELRDVVSNESWVLSIYNYINKNYKNIKTLNFYFGDIENDSAYLEIKKYENIFSNLKLIYNEIPRKQSFISHNGKKYAISSTNLRKALKEKKIDLASKFCDKNMFCEIKKYF